MNVIVKPLATNYAVVSKTGGIVCICNFKSNAEEIADILNADGDTEITYDIIEKLTDTEQRIFLSAMRREREVCRTVDEAHCNIDSEKKLVRVCDSIVRKVKKIWER